MNIVDTDNSAGVSDTWSQLFFVFAWAGSIEAQSARKSHALDSYSRDLELETDDDQMVVESTVEIVHCTVQWLSSCREWPNERLKRNTQ